jgi:pyruvate dehydrogenase E1 component
MVDLFRKEPIPSTFHWAFSPNGQHLELGIAEGLAWLRLRPSDTAAGRDSFWTN